MEAFVNPRAWHCIAMGKEHVGKDVYVALGQ
jgi:hypothetical protein